MPTRKIKDFSEYSMYQCRDPEHNPPTAMVYEPGIWEHECPTCRRKITFTVNAPTWTGCAPIIKSESTLKNHDVYAVRDVVEDWNEALSVRYTPKKEF